MSPPRPDASAVDARSPPSTSSSASAVRLTSPAAGADGAGGNPVDAALGPGRARAAVERDAAGDDAHASTVARAGGAGEQEPGRSDVERAACAARARQLDVDRQSRVARAGRGGRRVGNDEGGLAGERVAAANDERAATDRHDAGFRAGGVDERAVEDLDRPTGRRGIADGE